MTASDRSEEETIAIFRHHQTSPIQSNTAVFVVTFCGNSESDFCKSLKEKMERAKGFEPFTKKSELIDSQASSQTAKTDYTQIRAQIQGAFGQELAQVVATWPKLPQPLKAAILAIINSVEGGR